MFNRLQGIPAKVFKQDKTTMLFILGSIVVLVLLYVNIREYHTLNTINKTIEEREALLVFYEEFFDSYENISGRFKMIKANEVSSLMNEITKTGKKNNIDFLSIETKEIIRKKGEKFQRIPIHIETKSTYEKLGSFLGAFSTLDSATVVIKEFKVSRDIIIMPFVRSRILAEVLFHDDFIN